MLPTLAPIRGLGVCNLVFGDVAIAGGILGVGNPRSFGGLPTLRFTYEGSLSELDAILSKSKNSPSLLDNDDREDDALLLFLSVNLRGFDVGEATVFLLVPVDRIFDGLTEDGKSELIRGLPGLLFIGDRDQLSGFEAILPDVFSMSDVGSMALSFPFLFLLSFGMGVALFSVKGDINVTGGEETCTIFRGRPGLLFSGVGISPSELEEILSKSNDSPSLLCDPFAALPVGFDGFRLFAREVLRALIFTFGVLISLLSPSSETNMSSVATSGCSPLGSVGGSRR